MFFVFVKDIQNFLVKLNINIDDINNIINALDLNHTGIIDNSHYESIINIIIKEKESIIKLNCPIIQNDEDRKKEINNLWDCGIRPNYYYLLPHLKTDQLPTCVNSPIRFLLPSFPHSIFFVYYPCCEKMSRMILNSHYRTRMMKN